MEFILSFMLISWLFVVMAIWISKHMLNTYKKGKSKPVNKKKKYRVTKP